MWAQIAMAAVNTLEGWSTSRANRQLASAQYEYNRSAASNRGLANAAQNMMSMADANVNRYKQWRQNKLEQDAYGKAWSQQGYNSAKTMDALNSRAFEQRLAAAGNLGSMIASAAAAGVGGASVTQNMQVEELRQARQSDAMAQSKVDAQYADNEQRLALIDNSTRGISFDPLFSGLNYQAVDMTTDTSWQHKYSLGKAAMDGYNGFTGNMNNLNVDASNFTSKQESKGATGFGGASTMFSWFGGAGKSGAGATRL